MLCRFDWVEWVRNNIILRISTIKFKCFELLGCFRDAALQIKLFL